ncbi:MAG: PAS domain S-box protein [Smithella sp.]
MLKDQINHIYYEDIFETVREPLLVLNSDLMVISANQNFYHTFKVTPNKTLGRLIYDLGNQQWDIPKLRTLLEEIFPKEDKVDNYEVKHVFPYIGHKIILFNARRFTHKGTGSQLILLDMEDITERRRAEEELKESEGKLRAIYEGSNDAITILDETGFHDCNNRCLEIYRVQSRQDFCRCHPADLSPPFQPDGQDSLSAANTQIHKAFETGYSRFEWLHRRANGEEFYADILLSSFSYSGKKMLQATIRDISERKQSEAALKESEERYRALFDRSNDLLFIHDFEGNFIDMNPAALELTGYDREDISHLNFASLIDSEQAPKAFRIREELKTTGTQKEFSEFKLKCKDGKYIYVEAKDSVVYHDGKQYAILGIARDVTQRKQAEDELKASEEKYRLVVENALEIIYVIQDGKVKFINRRATELLGYPQEALTAKPFIEFVYPDDRNLVMERHIKRMSGESVPDVYSFRVVAADGTIKWIEIHAVMITWEGNPATLNFTGDITERKQAKDTLNLSLMKIRQALGATVQAISFLIETKDPYTAGHQRRVADLARSIATEMGMTTDQIDGIRMAAIIHDIGKISIPAEILSTPRKLTDIEFSLIKTHPQSGYDILKDIEFPWPIARMVLEHHERMNGSGYPNGIKGDQTLLESRILSVADVVEAMSSHRPYRPSLGIDAALDEITTNKGILYDQAVVDACNINFKEKNFKFHN